MAKKKAKRAPAKRAAPKKAAPAPKRAGRQPSKFKRVPVTKKFKDRFQKFYYYHRGDLNRFRRSSYQQKKKKGICVKCKKKSLSTSIFCAHHLNRSRVYNGRR